MPRFIPTSTTSLVLCVFTAALVLGGLFASIAVAGANPFRLAPLFQDGMVLQQKRAVPFWGTGTPGSTVTIESSWGARSKGVVERSGRWALTLKTPVAGGEQTVTLRHDDSLLVLKNVLVGEVWLCSGQSNMEMPLEGWPPNDTVSNAAWEIEHAVYPHIRLFSMQRSYSATPETECAGSWTACSPATVRLFSATAYFFGRKLHESLNVPVGLIAASWGGSPVEAWMSRESAGAFKEFAATLQAIDVCKESLLVQNRWLAARPAVVVTGPDPLHRWEGLRFEDDSCSSLNAADEAWPTMTLPRLWEGTGLGAFDGAVWFRTRVALPAAWRGRALSLHLGPIDDMDETYVNGAQVGSTMQEGYWKLERIYTVPDSLTRDSVAVIAVRVVDTQGGGGMWGDSASLALTCPGMDSTVSLAGSWKYLPVAEYRAGVFRVFGGPANGFEHRPRLPMDFSAFSLTSLFNGMIHPVIPFALRGAIWYQGEANTDNPARYQKTFPAMIAGWRKAFGQGDFPFYFVQLAPFAYEGGTQSQYLREAQRVSLRVPRTGMAVTLDIGDPATIHPAKKQEVGDRLALLALGKTYGKKLVSSGPVFTSMKASKGTLVLTFGNAGGGLVLRPDAGATHFLVAGKDREFKKADVVVRGSTLIVSHPDIAAPVAVRYAWGNTEPGTLFNAAGLPASSFRTDTW